PDSRSGRKAERRTRPESYTVQTDSGLEIRPELFDGEAREEAARCQLVSDTQMRRFFGAAKAEQMGMQSGNQARVAMALLKAKAHYAAARDKKNRELADLFGHHARLIRTKDDFGHFMRHFEAVIAYHKFNQQVRR
ncbi:MAG: type III-A CRISPR-associated protein Csm2, partial [Gammaproteobacteria bacterium]|nr:type III-A CRISPR-associated protein Csm2 [Gammaproteobacteria bacterium]